MAIKFRTGTINLSNTVYYKDFEAPHVILKNISEGYVDAILSYRDLSSSTEGNFHFDAYILQPGESVRIDLPGTTRIYYCIRRNHWVGKLSAIWFEDDGM
jgi:hypothetical protein